MKKILKTLSVIFIILCIVFLVIELVIIIKAKTKTNEIPAILGVKPLIVLSGSMEDVINKGDLVFVKEANADELEIGDIISFRNIENTVTTHRIVEIIEENGEKVFYTKGDNNTSRDSEGVTTDEIEGVYIFKIAHLGDFLMYLQEPQGLCVTILIVLIAGCIWILIGKKEDQKTHEKQN